MFLDRVELYRWGCIAHSVLMASFTECTLQSFHVGTIYSHSVIIVLLHICLTIDFYLLLLHI